MVERFQDELNIIKNKLETIGFFIEKEDDYCVVFGDGTSWKVDFYGERYGESTDLDIRNINHHNMQREAWGLSVYMILQTFGLNVLYQDKPVEEVMDLFIQYKDKIFDETFPYKEKYDQLNKYCGQF